MRSELGMDGFCTRRKTDTSTTGITSPTSRVGLWNNLPRTATPRYVFVCEVSYLRSHSSRTLLGIVLQELAWIRVHYHKTSMPLPPSPPSTISRSKRENAFVCLSCAPHHSNTAVAEKGALREVKIPALLATQQCYS